MKNKFMLIVLASVMALCALSAFACVPPFWGAEEELPEDFKYAYKGKRNRKNNEFKNLFMNGYQRKTF